MNPIRIYSAEERAHKRYLKRLIEKSKHPAQEGNPWRRLLCRVAIVLMLLPGVFTGFFPGKITAITTLCGWLFFFIYYKAKIQRDKFDGQWIWILWSIYLAVVYMRGFWNIITPSDGYAMAGTAVFFCFLFPQFIFLSQPKTLSIILRSFLGVGLLLCLVSYFFPPTDVYMRAPHNASFVNFFILCVPFVKKKWKITILFFAILVALIDTNRRSILVNEAFCFSMMLTWFMLKRKHIRRIFYVLLIAAPMVFLYLGLSGKFNLFEFMNEYSEKMNKKEDTDEEEVEQPRSLFVDSRTGIYLDVIGGLEEHNAYIFGLGYLGRTKTSLSDVNNGYYILYRYGRLDSESGMLNYVQTGGLIGLLLYGLFLIIASFKGTFRSENNLMKMVGLFVAFKFLYSFIEDKIQFDAHAFYIFLWVGMCYNKTFRSMTDQQIKLYLRRVFK